VNFTVPGAVAGTWPVCLLVTDGSGQSSTACTTVVGTSAPPPLADAGGGIGHSYSGGVNQAIVLGASASSDPLGHALSFNWAVNGGGVLSGADSAKPGVSFSASGTYFVTVTVSNGVGSAMATASVVVGPQIDAAIAAVAKGSGRAAADCFSERP
jgi:PKD repeat protein